MSIGYFFAERNIGLLISVNAADRVASEIAGRQEKMNPPRSKLRGGFILKRRTK